MKTTTKTSIAALLLLLAISCKKESVSVKMESAYDQGEASIKTGGHHLGERYGGGKIFWLDSTGLNGLIFDTVGLGQAVWWNGSLTSTGATGIFINTGFRNTKKIILSQGRPGNYAALTCATYRGGGYTDWFLPSKRELNELYNVRKQVGGPRKEIYWSSSETSNSNCWGQDFGPGWWHYDDGKEQTHYVLAVRAF